MKEYSEIGTDEMLEWGKMNGLNLSEGQAKDLVSDENADVNLDEWFKQNNIAPIGEYENLSKKMKSKIQAIIASLREEEKEQITDEADDRDANDTLDEKEGKEKLDPDKEKEVEERQRKKGKDAEDKEGQEKTEDDLEEGNKYKEEEDKQQETPKKDEYLAKVKKLHEMRIVDYKYQMRKDDPSVDKYFISMMRLQRNINKERAAFIKEYGSEELSKIENEYLKEELKYEKTLNNRMEKDLGKLRQLDMKLDSILDKMKVLQKSLENDSISLEEYNDEINALEEDKLETLWQINKFNPELLEEKQENLETRDMYERKTTPASVLKNKKLNMTQGNRDKLSALNYSERKQEGMAEDIHNDMIEIIDSDIDSKEKRLDDLRRELAGVDITTTEGKREALEIISEIQTLEAQKMSQEKQIDNLEKNMNSDIQSYGDLQKSEVERRDDTEEYQDIIEEINPNEVSNSLMAELKSQALEDPSTPEQAEEYLDNISEISEEAEKEQDDREKENDEKEPPTLWNRRKRPY